MIFQLDYAFCDKKDVCQTMVRVSILVEKDHFTVTDWNATDSEQEYLKTE